MCLDASIYLDESFSSNAREHSDDLVSLKLKTLQDHPNILEAKISVIQNPDGSVPVAQLAKLVNGPLPQANLLVHKPLSVIHDRIGNLVPMIESLPYP